MAGIANNLVCIDYETKDSRGASFEYFRKDFKVFALSCAWRDAESGEIVQWFSTNNAKIRQRLADFAYKGVKIVAHNIGYEYAVTKVCYPGIELNWYADTLRMGQIRDGGGNEFGEPELTLEQTIAYEMGELTDKEVNSIHYKKMGLSLEACAARFLTDETLHNHKQVAHGWLEEHKGIKKNFGRELHHLPYNMLEQYNNADTLVTLKLYETLSHWFKENDVEWQRDHQLYLLRGRLITGAYTKGIRINTDKLYEYILQLEDEIEAMEQELMTLYTEDMKVVEYLRFKKLAEWASDPELKSDRARFKRWVKILSGEKDPDWKVFNINSSKQLQILFMDALEMVPQFYTPKGSPSFKTTHLHQWGEGGKILQNRKKRILVLTQCVNTYLAAQYDGRVHCSVKVAGTRTNRVSGGILT